MNQNLVWSIYGRSSIKIAHFGPSIDASYQVSVHLAKRFQRRRFFRNRPIRNNNCLWRPFLLTDRDKMSNLYRGPSIDASYQVLVHLASIYGRSSIKLFILSRFVNKHGHHRQLLFLIGRFLKKIFSSETTWPNEQNLVGSIYERYFGSFGHSVSEENIFLEITRNKNCLWWPYL
jgi:hypothetical protein